MTAYVAFDTETTGVEPGSRVVELAAVAFDEGGKVRSTFEQLIHPGMPMPPDASAANGITDADLADRPRADVALAGFLDWLPDAPSLVAHSQAGHRRRVADRCALRNR